MPWHRTTSLRGRLMVSVSLGVACFLLAMSTNLFQLRAIGRAVAVVNGVYLPLTLTSSRILGQLDRAPADPAAVEATLAEAGALALRGLALPVDAEERAAVMAVGLQIADIERAWGTYRQLPGDSQREALRSEVTQLNTLVDGRIDAVSEKTAAAQAWAERLGGALILMSIALGGALLTLTGRALAPLTTLAEQVRRVGAGEADRVISIPGTDEVGRLSREFAQMVTALSERDRNLQSLTLYLRRVLDSIGSAVLVVEDGQVRMANPAAVALWGVRGGDALPPALASIEEGRSEREHANRTEEVVVRPFGESGRILVGEDITERKQDRDRLQRSERLALVGQMLAQVTHEVRNPLNAISLHAELLADEVHTASGRQLLDVVTGEIDRLERVTERYLDLARRRPAETSPEDPLALAEGVLSLEEEGLRRQGIQVRADGDAGTTVDLDGNTVRRALLNLVRNAADAGARSIQVHVRRLPNGCTFVVEDDGPGMEPDVAARVFEPFFSTRARGTGLGLAITRQSIEDLGGAVKLETAPGQGTRFTLTLPDDKSSRSTICQEGLR